MNSPILIVDDDRIFCTVLKKNIEEHGRAAEVALNLQEASESLRLNEPELVILDAKLPDGSGIEYVREIKNRYPHLPILMVSASGETSDVVGAIQNGASDYVKKPINEEEIFEKIDKLVEIRKIIRTEHELETQRTDHPILGKSPATRQLIREISKVANSDATVLLRGESGTGKSLVAEVIHGFSPRKPHRFVAINCAAIPLNLLESELFGHEKGSFTGAIRDKPGKFELADKGTIFLDEIGDLPPELQVKLLRVLQGGEFERVGGLKTHHVNVRVIAATNRNLEEAIAQKRFREDLFYRLNVLPIYNPPLRERREDIPLLVDFFVRQYSLKANKRFEKISDLIVQQLRDYSWPGNIRELQNVIERAIVLGREPRLMLSDFILPRVSLPVSPPLASSALEMRSDTGPNLLSFSSLKDLEQHTLLQALQRSGGNVSVAAKHLGISRGTIYRRLRKFQIGLKG